LDEYEQAKADTDQWLTFGWITPEDIVRWRHTCSGIRPDVAIALGVAGVSPRLATTRLRYGKVDPDAEMLWERVQSGEMIADDARWLLKRAGLLAA
jgi:hypothetical protein